MYNLNWTQAQEAMREGKRVRNSNFTTAEWFAFDGRYIVDEEGYYMDKWYKGYDWQNEGWMILDEMQQCLAEVKEIVKKHNVVVVCDNFSALEDRVIALFTGGCYTADTMDYWVGITPRSPKLPREKQNYNLRITKGRGHNKFKKRKKK